MPAAEGEHDAPLRRGAVIWRVDLRACSSALLAMEAATPRLAAGDERRAAAQGGGDPHHPRARERRAAYVALRLALERAFGAECVRGLELQRSELGRPSLAHCPGDFSLTHVSGYALIGIVREGSIGVDLERLRTVRMSDRRREAIVRAGLALEPGAPLPTPSPERFLAAWVRLEAFAKAARISMARVLTAAGALGGGDRLPDTAMRERLHALVRRCADETESPPRVHVLDLNLAGDLFGAMAWSGRAEAAFGALPPVMLDLAAVPGESEAPGG